MKSDTDTNSSSSPSLSEQERKRSKLHKKLKRKSEKKHKKVKKKKCGKEKKKHSHKDIEMQNEVFRQSKLEKDCNVNEEIDAFGPALPPHLLHKRGESEEIPPSVVGPTIPKEFLGILKQSELQSVPEKYVSQELHKEPAEGDDNLHGSYGPLPVLNEHEMTPAQLELEERALELKMAAIDGTNASKINQNVREEWMLELPNVGLKSGLAALNNLKRGFHQGKEKPDFSDRSSWTKATNSSQEKHNVISSKEELKLAAQTLYDKQRDAEQEAIAKKHKKKHKRDESLVEIHQKKLRAEEKRKAKELREIGAKPERRPFTRDVDLKLNKIDRNQTKQIVDKAKILNTKFSSGHSKYL